MAGPMTKPIPNAALEHAEEARAVGLRGDVGDRALGHGHAGPGHPVDDPAGEQHPERTGRGGDEAPDGGPEQRQEQDRLAPNPIGKPSEQGRAHELGRGERGDEQPDLDAAGPEALGVAGQDRHDDAEADQVECDRRPDDPEPGRIAGRRAGGHGGQA